MRGNIVSRFVSDGTSWDNSGHVHGGFGRYEHQDIPIYKVSVVDESCRLVNAPTVIDLPDV